MLEAKGQIRLRFLTASPAWWFGFVAKFAAVADRSLMLCLVPGYLLDLPS